METLDDHTSMSEAFAAAIKGGEGDEFLELDENGIFSKVPDLPKKYSDQYHAFTKRVRNLLRELRSETDAVDRDPRLTDEGKAERKVEVREDFFDKLREEPGFDLAGRLAKNAAFQRESMTKDIWPPKVPDSENEIAAGFRGREIRDRVLAEDDPLEREIMLDMAAAKGDSEFLIAVGDTPAAFPIFSDEQLTEAKDIYIAAVLEKLPESNRVALRDLEYTAGAFDMVVRRVAAITGVKDVLEDE